MVGGHGLTNKYPRPIAVERGRPPSQGEPNKLYHPHKENTMIPQFTDVTALFVAFLVFVIVLFVKSIL